MYRRSQIGKGKPVLIGAAPIIRRLRALAVIGYGLVELSEIIGMNRGDLGEIRRGRRRSIRLTTAKKIVESYRKLQMTPSRHSQSVIVAERARRAGWHSPLHWADIDKGIADEGEYE